MVPEVLENRALRRECPGLRFCFARFTLEKSPKMALEGLEIVHCAGKFQGYDFVLCVLQ